MAVGGQPVADTYPPSGSHRAAFSASAELLVYQGHPIFIISSVISAL